VISILLKPTAGSDIQREQIQEGICAVKAEKLTGLCTTRETTSLSDQLI